jgi:hypothetical protein
VRIRRLVNADFDRVEAAFRTAAERQRATRRAETHAILAALEEKGPEVMRTERAGCFTRWQEIAIR